MVWGHLEEGASGLVQAQWVLPRTGKRPQGPSLRPASEQSRSEVGQVGEGVAVQCGASECHRVGEAS